MDKKKKRPKSSVRAADAVEADDWAPYTAPDGRVYYYNQVRERVPCIPHERRSQC